MSQVYSSSTRRILEFDLELIESNTNSLSSRVRISQYLSQATSKVNRALLFY